MREKSNLNIKLFFYILLLFSIVAGSLLLFYKEKNKGYLKIDSPQTEIKIFVDKKEVIPSKFPSLIKLFTGKHSVVLSKVGFWPWIKTFKINKKQVYEITPFFVSRKTQKSIISKTDPRYQKIIFLFNSKKTYINWEKDKNTPSIIKNFASKIKASDFYKNREDVIIIAVKDGIYALEINSSSIPNFQPIYKGIKPTFIKKDNNSLYVKDGNTLMEVPY